METISFGTKNIYAALGQGTWRMGSDPSVFAQEVEVIRYGIRNNLRVIDTAAMYADGGAERVVGEAVHPHRENVFIVTKVWPTSASYEGVISSLRNSLERLGISYVDLFLLHWPSAQHPLKETLRAMTAVYDNGWAKAIGVSNFNVDLLKQAQQFLGSIPLIANQIEYSLANRAAETTVIPYCLDHNITVMAYSPIKHVNSLAQHSAERIALREIASKYGVTEHVIALAWVIRNPGVIAVPKTSHKDRLLSNLQALSIEFNPEDGRRLDTIFPPASGDLPVRWL
jgi:diketogulonate reductase-like aldo/keto reductase